MYDTLREVLANALIHVDYNERHGIVIEKRLPKLEIEE
jgi:predicted HTH transcriptional regulator